MVKYSTLIGLFIIHLKFWHSYGHFRAGDRLLVSRPFVTLWISFANFFLIDMLYSAVLFSSLISVVYHTASCRRPKERISLLQMSISNSKETVVAACWVGNVWTSCTSSLLLVPQKRPKMHCWECSCHLCSCLSVLITYIMILSTGKPM